MANRNTIWDSLTSVFDKGVSVPKDTTSSSNVYNLDGGAYQAKDREDYDVTKRELQQQKYLQSTWAKVDGELYQKTIHYETSRIGSYSDFENMEFFPEIGAALDIFMEESVTTNGDGNILNIYSNSDRVKKILTDLFVNRLNIHTNLPMWTRNVAKYGDNFIYLNLQADSGVVGARQLPNYEIERHEGDAYNIVSRYNGLSEEDKENAGKIRYIWKGRDTEFTAWQITHFRLLGDDRKLPYGTSLLEKARRIYKQLLVSEDAMLVYRVTRAPERRVYKINVGNIDTKDVNAFVNNIANKFKRKPLIDPQTGQIDVKYNQMSQDQDIFIPVRSENASTPIDTLQGASNLDAIADIEYLQNKLFAALRVPKPFLGFEDAAGEGKNLALQDIRFARTINRLQQSMIQGLNSIAIIHLYMLGFEDELDNFTITLNNPSTQAEMLRLEQLQSKISAYRDAVTDAGNGFATMSMSRARKEILGMSEDEIKHDLLEQRFEKAAASELEKTSEIIKRTGTFDTVDNLYGDPDAEYSDENAEGGGSEGAAGGGSDFGGGDDLGDFGAEEIGDEDFGDEEGGEDFGDEDFGGEDFGAEEITDEEGDFDIPEPEATEESKKSNNENLITEIIDIKKSKKPSVKHMNALLGTIKNDKPKEPIKMWDNKRVKINENIDSMIKGLDDKLNG
jgi:hypothetical protein